MKQKKWLFWGLRLGVGAGILGSFLFIFWTPIFEWAKNLDSSQKIAPPQIEEKPSGLPNESSFVGRIRRAENLLQSGKPEVAALELAAAIREKQDLISPYLLLAEVYLQTDQTEKMQALLTEIQQKFPSSDAPEIFAARTLIRQKDFTAAASLLQQNAGNLPPELEFYRAVFALLQNDESLAREILSELEKLPVQAAQIEVGRSGLREVESEDRQTVPKNFSEKVVGLMVVLEEFESLSDGKTAHLLTSAAKVLAENNEPTLAKSFAETAIKEDIAYIDAWILRGYSFFLLRNFDSALADLRHAYSLDPIRPQTHYFLALTLLENQNLEEAALFFEKSLEHDFEFASEIRWKLIEIYTKTKKYDRVVELYQFLIGEKSTEPKQVVQSVSSSLDLMQNPEMALQITQSLVKNYPEDIFSLNMHAWALIANKNFLEAENWLNAAKEIDPKNPRTFLNLGLLAEEQARFEDAKSFYKKSYELGKSTRTHAITNLAATQYNALIENDRNPEIPPAPNVPANSP